MTLLTSIFGLAALFSLGRAVLARHQAAISPALDSREADISHFVMNGSMALMGVAAMAGAAALARWGDFALWGLAAGLAAWLAWCIAQPRLPGSIVATVYHLVSVLAMIYAMYLLGHGAAEPPAAAMNSMVSAEPMSHLGHGDQGGGLHGTTPEHSPGGWAVPVLGVLFLLDGLLTIGPALVAPGLLRKATAAMAGPDRPPPMSRQAYIQAAFAHVVMDFGMAWLLLT